MDPIRTAIRVEGGIGVATTDIAMIDHKHLFTVLRILPTDYADCGGKVVRWEKDDEGYPDCSCGCKWAAWLGEPFQFDWCVCTKPGAPRSGLLTFEHMAGRGCFEESDEVANSNG